MANRIESTERMDQGREDERNAKTETQKIIFRDDIIRSYLLSRVAADLERVLNVQDDAVSEANPVNPLVETCPCNHEAQKRDGWKYCRFCDKNLFKPQNKEIGNEYGTNKTE